MSPYFYLWVVMKYILPSLCLLLFAGFLLSCNGQNAPRAVTGNYSIVLGDTVTSIADTVWVVYQDKNNNYWFGSNGRGIYCYNGEHIYQFTTKHGLSNNHISNIKEDNNGNLYFTTATGVDKYDGKTIAPLLIDDSQPNNWEYSNNNLWFRVGMNDGYPYRYDGKKLQRLTFPKNQREDEFRKMFPNTGYSPYSIYTIYTDSKGRVWFGTAVLGVGCFDGKKFTWIAEDDLTEIHNGPSNGLRSIVEDKNGDFWFSNTFYSYTISNNSDGGISYKRKQAANATSGFEYLSAIKDTDGNLWIVTYKDGVWKYDGKTYTHYPINATLYTIYQDKKGILWVGTHTDGVYKWDGTTFKKFTF